MTGWCAGSYSAGPWWADLCAFGAPPVAVECDPRERFSGYGQGPGCEDFEAMRHGDRVTGVAERCWTPAACSSGDRAADLRRIVEDIAANGGATTFRWTADPSSEFGTSNIPTRPFLRTPSLVRSFGEWYGVPFAKVFGR